MGSSVRIAGVLALGVAVCVTCGCVDEKVSEGTTVFSFAPWVLGVSALVALLAVPVGWRLRSKRYGWALAVAGPIVLAVVIPGLMRDRVEIDAQHFALRTGLWFAPRCTMCASAISLKSPWAPKRRTRRGTQTDYFLDCQRKAGATERVPIGTLMEEAVGTILDTAERQGVLIIDRTGG